MKDQIKIEYHPDWYYDIKPMKILILGSFPPHETKRNYPFYYPNKINYFWKILAAIADLPLKHFSGKDAVEERKQIMEILQVGIQNMGKKITRKGTSAKDTDIVILEYHNILSIIRNHAELETIILAGFSAPHSTYFSFIRYLKANHINYITPSSIKPGSTFRIFIDDREINCVITNSTSPATFIKPDILIQQYLVIISAANKKREVFKH